MRPAARRTRSNAMWEYRYVDRYDAENESLLESFLEAGWEPFAAEHDPGGRSRIHLRRQISGTPAAGG